MPSICVGTTLSMLASHPPPCSHYHLLNQGRRCLNRRARLTTDEVSGRGQMAALLNRAPCLPQSRPQPPIYYQWESSACRLLIATVASLQARVPTAPPEPDEPQSASAAFALE